METKRVLLLIVSGIVPRVKSNRKKSLAETVFCSRKGIDRKVGDKNRKVFLNREFRDREVSGNAYWGFTGF